MSESVVGVAIGLVVGIPLSFLLAYLLYRFQMTRLELGYYVVTAEPLVTRDFGPDGPVKILVDKHAFGLLEEEGVLPVLRVYSFKISLKNTGNVAIQEVPVYFQLSDAAKIVKVEASLTDSKILRSFPSDLCKPNIGKIDLSFLNPGEEILIEAMSVDNSDLRCDVWGEAPNLRVFDRWARAQRAYNVRVKMSWVLVPLVLGLLFLLDWQNFPGARAGVAIISGLLLLLGLILLGSEPRRRSRFSHEERFL